MPPQTRAVAGALGEPKNMRVLMAVVPQKRLLCCCFDLPPHARGCPGESGLWPLLRLRQAGLWFGRRLSQEEPALPALPALLLEAQRCPKPTQPCGQAASAPARRQEGEEDGPSQRFGRQAAFCGAGELVPAALLLLPAMTVSSASSVSSSPLSCFPPGSDPLGVFRLCFLCPCLLPGSKLRRLGLLAL